MSDSERVDTEGGTASCSLYTLSYQSEQHRQYHILAMSQSHFLAGESSIGILDLGEFLY